MAKTMNIEMTVDVLKALTDVGLITTDDKLISYLSFELKVGEPIEVNIKYIPASKNHVH